MQDDAAVPIAKPESKSKPELVHAEQPIVLPQLQFALQFVFVLQLVFEFQFFEFVFQQWRAIFQPVRFQQSVTQPDGVVHRWRSDAKSDRIVDRRRSDAQYDVILDRRQSDAQPDHIVDRRERRRDVFSVDADQQRLIRPDDGEHQPG